MLNASQLHPACFPIQIATNDRFVNKNLTTNFTTCMSFVRSIAGPRLDCSLGYADQVRKLSREQLLIDLIIEHFGLKKNS